MSKEKRKEEKIKTRKIYRYYRPFFRLVRKIAKFFKRRPTIFNLNKEPLDTNALYLSNHSGASGPLVLSLYMPIFIIPWGAHEMVGNYRTRWKYLYYVFYQQKLKYKKFKSFMIATFFAIISKMLYRGMQLIPTYQDLRFKNTLNHSINVLNKGLSILIFPEDSTDGYDDVIKSFNAGFVLLAERYYKETKKDLPIYPLYFLKRKNAYVIGPKQSVSTLLDKGMNRDEIANHFKNITNNLGEYLDKKEI
ncbi:MAG: hypothetical protein WCZ47_04310 [Bacilli bacterium]|jgi:1-acyl-sn-glycerol-3-phosphate acyltransferase